MVQKHNVIISLEKYREVWIYVHACILEGQFLYVSLPTSQKKKKSKRKRSTKLHGYAKIKSDLDFDDLISAHIPHSHDPNNRAAVFIFPFFLRGQKLGLLTKAAYKSIL